MVQRRDENSPIHEKKEDPEHAAHTENAQTGLGEN